MPEKTSSRKTSKSNVLILGIGNLLMGDEGVGVHLIRALEGTPLPSNVICLDGGTGSFILLEPMGEAGHIVLIDATIDDHPVGHIQRLTPKFSKDFPTSLTAHDIGLKDLLDSFYIMGEPVDVTLFAVTINPLGADLTDELSPEIKAILPELAQRVVSEAKTRAATLLPNGQGCQSR